MTVKQKQMDLTQGPLLKNIIVYSIPLIFTGLLQNFYHAADLVVVGHFNGHLAVAAVGSTSSLYHLVINLFMGLSVGAGVCVAQYVGAKDDEGVHKVVHTSFSISLLFGALVALVGMLLARPILAWMDTPANVLDQAVLYLQILFLGMPATMLYNYMASIMRSAGDTKKPLLFLTVSGLVNVGLNLLLVAVLGWGVAGVAIGTVASNVVASLMILISLARRDDCLKFRLRNWMINGKQFVRIMRIGIPSGLQSTMFSISNVLIQSAINGFGDIVVAGNSAATNIESFMYVAMNAISVAATTFVGQFVGARKYAQVRRVLFCCIGVTVVMSISMGSVIYLLHHPLLSLYSKGNAEVEAAAMARLGIIVFTYFLCGIMEVISGALRSLGKALAAMIITVVGVCGLRVFWVSVIFPLFPTLSGIYWSYPISWSLTALVQLIVLIITVRHIMRRGSLSDKQLP